MRIASSGTCLGVIAAIACARGPRGSPAPPVEVVLRPHVGRLTTVGAVIGRDSVSLLLDTGGGETLIAPRVAAEIGCVPRGRSVGFRLRGERVEFRRFAGCPPSAFFAREPDFARAIMTTGAELG